MVLDCEEVCEDGVTICQYIQSVRVVIRNRGPSYPI